MINPIVLDFYYILFISRLSPDLSSYSFISVVIPASYLQRWGKCNPIFFANLWKTGYVIQHFQPNFEQAEELLVNESNVQFVPISSSSYCFSGMPQSKYVMYSSATELVCRRCVYVTFFLAKIVMWLSVWYISESVLFHL